MRLVSVCIVIVLAWSPHYAGAADSEELELIRQQIESLRNEYESRIRALEQNLEQAETRRYLEMLYALQYRPRAATLLEGS